VIHLGAFDAASRPRQGVREAQALILEKEKGSRLPMNPTLARGLDFTRARLLWSIPPELAFVPISQSRARVLDIQILVPVLLGENPQVFTFGPRDTFEAKAPVICPDSASVQVTWQPTSSNHAVNTWP
jgi:hypothetical protein